MGDRGWIIGGLLVFLSLVTLPVWYNLAAGTTPKRPDVERPAEEKACVASVEYMKTSHMNLLMDWQTKVVRQRERTVVGLDGKTYTMSLTQTCMQCHKSKADFCDRCHDYAGVKPTCWNCHVDPKDPALARRSTP